jgi:predicted secreted Zn-dependent protease
VNRVSSYTFGLILLAAASAPADNLTRWTTNYYNVAGSTIRDIHRSLAQSRPWRDKSSTDGLTDWHVTWHFYVAASGDKCRCTSFSTTTTITMTLPRWIAATNTPPEIKTAWQRYATALGQHEAGHAQFALNAAAEMQKQGKNLEMPNCDALRSQISSQCQAILDDFRNREKAYDERTKHGATQGAFLRPDRPNDSFSLTNAPNDAVR